MNIRIKTIKLSNFKCFREKEFSFPSDVVTISGRNGAGKTTVADAILWCLFGKNTAGQSDFDLKTHDEQGQTIPHLDHSVQLCLSLLREETEQTVTLCRTLKETWVKKRGADEEVFKNNTTEYLVNGELYTAADYKKYIASLISEDVFRAITNPQYFPSLKWQDQRKFLEVLAGDIEQPADVEFAELLSQLSANNEDIIAYRKHLSYQIKEIKRKLDLIPTRLEEQNKALPERLDWNALQVECDAVSQHLKTTDEKILQIKQGNGADVKRTELRKQIEETTVKVQFFVKSAQDRYAEQYAEKSACVRNLTLKFNEALNNQKLMEQTIEADHRLIERCKETDYEAELQKLRDQWPTAKFSVDPDMAYCPTCGQPIPQEQYEEKVEQMRRKFNLGQEEKKKKLNEAAAKVNQQKEAALEELNKMQQKLSDDENALKDIKEQINTIFAEKSKAEKANVTTVEELLSESVEYVALSKQLQQLNEALSTVTSTEVDQQALTDLEQQRSSYADTQCQLQQQFATRIQYERILALIDAINEEQKDLIRQLSKLEKQEDIARQYQFRQNQLLEEQINKHFKITRWRLFRTVNNGGDPFDEPYCECYDLNGTAYHDGLNQAARLNMGLDIINALCNFYSVSAPIVLDNSESTINILETVGQQVRLQVADTELTIV